MDRLTAALLFTALLFTPWAFGTTEEWSIWFMNELGYAVGLVLVGKWLIRLKTGWCPVRWNDVTATQSPRLAL